jgi:hypothetical protein
MALFYMSLPEGNRSVRDNNRIPLQAGVSYLNNNAIVQANYDPATGAQLVSVVSGGSSSPTSVLSGKTTVTTSGTRVALATSTTSRSVIVKALATNTGTIYVGNSSVSSASGLQLAAGDSVSFDITNLSTVNIDASVNGEGVTYLGVA